MKLFKITLIIFLLVSQLFIINPKIANWEYKGSSIIGYNSDSFNNINVYKTIDYLKSLGSNTVSIIVTWFQKDFDSIEIYSDQENTLNDTDLIKIIKYCHKQGLKVNLKTHLDLVSEDGTYTKWRALISPKDIKEWFNEYEKFINHYYNIAIENEVELYTVGTEMVSMTRPQYLRYWQNLISKLRKGNFKGQITYCADQSETFGSKTISRDFWALFDVISISSYYPSSIDWNVKPSYKLLEKEWLKWKGDLEAWKNGLKINKKVIIGEMGFRSIDYTHKAPYKTFGEIKKGNNNYNEALQADCYKAMLNALDKISWIDGLIMWQEIITTPPVYFEEKNLTYSIINKSASDIIKKYFSNSDKGYSKIVKNSNEITGEWYYFNDNESGGKSKIIINGKETLDFKILLKDIDGVIKQVSLLSGFVTKDFEYASIGMGVNLSESSKEEIKKAIGIKFKVITNLKEFNCSISTSNITDFNYYNASVKMKTNSVTEVTILFKDLKQYDFGEEKPFLKDMINAIFFLTTDKPIKNVSLEMFDLELIK